MFLHLSLFKFEIILIVKCQYCGKEIEKYVGHVNRANKMGYGLFCNQTCWGLNSRTTVADKKKVKADYDKKISNTPERKAARRGYFQKSYKANPEKYRAIRKKKYQHHLQYLSTDKYKKWKYNYDQKYVAKKEYGVFWECYLLVKELEDFLFKNSPDGMHFQMGITNKTQIRKRLWQRTNKQKNLLQRA